LFHGLKDEDAELKLSFFLCPVTLLHFILLFTFWFDTCVSVCGFDLQLNEAVEFKVGGMLCDTASRPPSQSSSLVFLQVLVYPGPESLIPLWYS
jgi:hypothetical protein